MLININLQKKPTNIYMINNARNFVCRQKN